MRPVSTLRQQIAARVAGWLPDGAFVNVGIGLPGMVPAQVGKERAITFHAEHGVIGFAAASPDAPLAEVLEFFGNRYVLPPGASIVDHTLSFAMIRAGLVDVTVLGAFEVAADGTFASHRNDAMPSAGVGGAPELAGGCASVIVALEHCTASGTPRLVERCRLPVGLDRRIELVVTEHGAFRPLGDAFAAVELAPGVSLEEVQRHTAAPVFDARSERGRLAAPRRGRVRRDADKVLADSAEAVAGIRSGMTVAIGGWGGCGTPDRLVLALALAGLTDLTVVCAGVGPVNDLAAAGCVSHVITSFASYAGRNSPSAAFDELYRQGGASVELCSQGVLAERLRAGGAGLGGCHVPAELVGRFHSGDEVVELGGRRYVFEPAIRADVALVRASRADPFGNLGWVDGERNYNQAVATAGELVVVDADRLLPLGGLDPAQVMVPGVFVDRVLAPG